MIKIEVEWVHKDDSEYCGFSYCEPDEILATFERLKENNLKPIATRLTDAYGRRIENN